MSVRLGGPLDETEGRRRGNSASSLQPAEARERFRDHPKAVAESARLGRAAALRPHQRSRLQLSRRRGRDRRSPTGRALPGSAGAAVRAGSNGLEGRPSSAYRAEAEGRLEEELELIRSCGFLGSSCSTTTCSSWHARWRPRSAARTRRGDCSRRGAAGAQASAPWCYLTGLSHIDPVENDLFLGRFLNEELTDAPDIDLDFPRDIREKLIPRVHERYGQERSALVAAFATYRARERCATWARRWGCRRARSSAWRGRSTSRRRAATRRRGWTRRWGGCGAPALAGAGRGCCRRSRDCPATSPSTPGGW